MLLRQCTKAGGFRGFLLVLLCIAGYFIVATAIAWGIYGDFSFTFNEDLWVTCLMVGLTATAVWVILVDGVASVLWFVARKMPWSTLAAHALMVGIVTVFFTIVLAALATGPSPSASDIYTFMVEHFPKAYIFPLCMALYGCYLRQ